VVEVALGIVGACGRFWTWPELFCRLSKSWELEVFGGAP